MFRVKFRVSARCQTEREGGREKGERERESRREERRWEAEESRLGGEVRIGLAAREPGQVPPLPTRPSPNPHSRAPGLEIDSD